MSIRDRYRLLLTLGATIILPRIPKEPVCPHSVGWHNSKGLLWLHF